MSGELVDRIIELLLQVAALEYDIKELRAEASNLRGKAEAYDRLSEGNLADTLDKDE